MAFRVLCSSHTDRLIRDLVLSLKAPGDATQFRPVLLPSVPLREKVRVELARKLGVAMGVDFLLPSAFFNRVAETVQIQGLHPAWEPEGLFWRLLPWVKKMAKGGSARLAGLGNDETALLSLARQVADRFDQYMHYRPDLIRAWDAGKSWSGLPKEALVDEEWQRALWDCLKSDRGSEAHLVARFDELKVKLAGLKVWPFSAPLEALITGPLPLGTLELLEILGRLGEVRLRVLMPSREHLSFIKSLKRQRRAGEAADPEREGHPLLASMGHQSVESFQVLEKLLDASGGDFENLDADDDIPEQGPAQSLLTAIQQDIRAARQPRPDLRPVHLEGDRSLRVHPCHGARREVEVLRDELLVAFETLPGLTAEDVLILTPNLEAHAHLAEALLPAAGYGIPLSLIERSELNEDPLLGSLVALLKFSAGRATLSEGLGLLDLPGPQAVLGEDLALALAARIESTGITFGLDGRHRHDLDAGDEHVGTWRAGLDRLLEGLWLGSDAPAERVDKNPSLSLAGDLSSGRGEDLRALQWMDELLATSLAWRSPATPDVWAGRLKDASNALFSHDDLQRADLSTALDWLQKAEEDFACKELLGPDDLATQLEAMVEGGERRVRASAGRLGLGGLKPLRAVPCRVLALLGLSDPAFPRRTHAPAWDLMAAQPLPGDRDPREEDRQLFLDALISASERVIITAPTRHVVTDKDLPFSVCVDELLRCAEITVAQDAAGRALVRPILVPRHPLQPFARANFAPPGSFDTASRNLGLAMEAPRSEPEPFFKRGRAVALETDPEILTVDVLHAFFCDPAKVWLQGLKLRLPKEGGSKERDEDPMDPPADLREWQIRDAGITQALLQASPKARRRALDTLVADRVLSYGELGQAQARKILEGVEAAVDPILQAGGVQRQLFEADLEPRLVGELSVAEHGKTLALVTASNLTKGKTLLKSWLHVALAAAAGKPLPLLRVGADDRRKVVRDRLPAEQVSKAKKALQTLAHLRQEGLSEPLAFELDLSLELALEIRAALAEQRPLRPGIADAWEEQLEKNACLALAWRDRDPFKGKGLARWKEIASAVWDPVLDWQEAAGGEHA